MRPLIYRSADLQGLDTIFSYRQTPVDFGWVGLITVTGFTDVSFTRRDALSRLLHRTEIVSN
jgi:hypothetical protein